MIRSTTRKHSSAARLIGATLAAAALLTVAATPSVAADGAGCGAYVIHGGGGTVTVSGCTIDQCVLQGGQIATDGIRAYCCVTSGSGKDQVTVCDEVDQLIDLFQVPTTTTTLPVRSTRPFGAPSRFLAR